MIPGRARGSPALAAWRRHAEAPTTDADRPRRRCRRPDRRGPATWHIVLLSPTGTLRSGRNTFTIEFRSPTGDARRRRHGARRREHVDARHGDAGKRAGDSGEVSPGRYTATAEFGMAGSWQMSIEWNGPAGRGSVNFEGAVQ